MFVNNMGAGAGGSAVMWFPSGEPRNPSSLDVDGIGRSWGLSGQSWLGRKAELSQSCPGLDEWQPGARLCSGQRFRR